MPMPNEEVKGRLQKIRDARSALNTHLGEYFSLVQLNAKRTLVLEALERMREAEQEFEVAQQAQEAIDDAPGGPQPGPGGGPASAGEGSPPGDPPVAPPSQQP